MEYKITARRNTNCKSFKDPTNKKVIWDGKAKTMQLTYGNKEMMTFMFNNMKKYVDKSEWTLKLVPKR